MGVAAAVLSGRSGFPASFLGDETDKQVVFDSLSRSHDSDSIGVAQLMLTECDGYEITETEGKPA